MENNIELIRKKVLEVKKNCLLVKEKLPIDKQLDAQIKVADYILSFIDSLQEEPVRKVWHDSNKEQPKCGSNVVIWSPTLETGELITKCAKVFENRIWAYLDDLIYMQYD